MLHLNNVTTPAGTNPKHSGNGSLLTNLDPTQVSSISTVTAVDPALADSVWGVNAATTNQRMRNDYLLGLVRISPGGRLTLTSATPVTTSDVTAATTIYYAAYDHGMIDLWDGTRWQYLAAATASLAVGTLINGMMYDVFGFLISGLLSLEMTEWKNATTTITNATPAVLTIVAHGMSTGNTFILTNSGGALPTGLSANVVYYVTVVTVDTFKLSTTSDNLGAGTFIPTSSVGSGTHTGHIPHQRQTGVSIQDGLQCKTGDKTRLYLGSVLATSTTTLEDSKTKRFVWNMYNRVRRPLVKQDTTAGTAYTTATWKTYGAGVAKIEFIQGLQEGLTARFVGKHTSTVGSTGTIGLNLNSTTATPTGLALSASCGGGVSGFFQDATALYDDFPAIGYNYFAGMMIGGGGTSNVFYGSGSNGGGYVVADFFG